MDKEGQKTVENLNVISAVVCYKTVLGNDLKFRLRGTMFLNPAALNPLTKAQANKISQALFGVSLEKTVPRD